MAAMCPECGAAEQRGAACGVCGHVFVQVAQPAQPAGEEVSRRWRRVERATWAYMAVVGSARFGLALRDGSRSGWMLAGAALMVLWVLWAVRARRVFALKLWTLAVCVGAGLSVPATVWAFGGLSAEARAVAVLSTAAVCAYAVELLRARRVIVGV